MCCFYFHTKPTATSIFLFALFASIAMTVGVLTVSFTSSKTRKTCHHTFKRIGKSSITSSSQPRSIAVGDFNNDNQMDIVVGNSGTDTIGIFLSGINGTLANQQTYSTGSHSLPYSVVVNDFNNDNCLDIAVANYGTNNIGIFLGYGNGTFTSQKVFSTGSSRPVFITSGDFNNDNLSDIAIANYGTNDIGVLIGYGNGSFQNQITSFIGYDSLPNSLAVGDFDHDNRLDIVVANFGIDNTGIFLGYGNGSFTNQQTYTTRHGSHPSSIAVGDINNDNHLDIVVANNNTSNIGILVGFGNGTFSVQTTSFIGSHSYPQHIAIGNFDNDRYFDVVVVDTENDQIHILLGYSNGIFATITTYDMISQSRPFFVAVTDFNKDNQSDIVVANYDTHDILILMGYTSEPSARKKNHFFGRGSEPSSVVINDFNNDNHLDLVVNGLTRDDVQLLINYGNGTFMREKTFSTGYSSMPQQLCAADLNHDQRMDIVTANLGSDSVGVLLGDNNGTFVTVTTYSTGTGSTPIRVVVDDVNNDNQLDIISANLGTHSVGVLLGHGNGSFTPVVTFSTGIGSGPCSIAVGDVNNDHHVDIVTANCYSNTINILFGNGNGTFSMLRIFSTGYSSGATSIVLADFNSDNCLDIVIANTITGDVGIFLGYGNGIFGAQTIYSISFTSRSYSVIAADFNRDNRLDIAVTLFGHDEVVILFGHGNGSFQLARTYFTGSGSHPYGIAVADFNNDTQLEIVVTLWGTGEIAILTEYVAAKFSKHTVYSTGSAPQPYSVAIGDFNSDNRSDIVVANSGTDSLSIGFGLGNGMFASQKMYSTGVDSHPQYVITGDMNNDNHLDIITVNSKHDSISMIMGYGNGSFASETVYSTGVGSHPSAVVLGDFNNDNRSDLAIVNTGTDSIATLVGYDYALFESRRTYRSENNLGPCAIITADFNHDNYIDIAAAFTGSGTVAILLGYGNGNFGDTMSYSQGIGSFPVALATDDVNSDGNLDIVIANYGTSSITIRLGNGNGSFTTNMTFSTGSGSGPSAVAIADFNNDSRLDVSVTNSESYNVGILLGYGNGSFATVMSYSTGDGSLSVAIVVNDFNKDSRLDIAVVNRDASNVGIFLGYGNGSFASQVTYATAYYSAPNSIVVGDFNGDKNLDIAVVNYNYDSIGIFLGFGNGTFAVMQQYPLERGSSPKFITVGDFNNDNRSDIVSVNYGTNNVIIYFGFEHGVFYNAKPYSIGVGSGPLALATGDFDNNNQLDFAVVNYGTNDIGVFLGYGNEPFADITSYNIGAGSQPHAVATGDFNNDGRSDIVIANYGTNNVGIFLAYDYSAFENRVTYSTGVDSTPCSIAVGKFNSDDHLDIAVANCETDTLVILLGLGNGTFTPGATYSTGTRSRPHSIAIADFNNDNLKDIVVANSGTNNILILYGYGNGTFGNEESYPLGYDYRPYSIAINDLNEDGWMDIVVACYGTNNVEILMRIC